MDRREAMRRARERRTAELVAARELTPSVRELTFAIREGSPIEFVAGQYANFHLGQDQGLQRSYSMAAAPSDAGTLTVAVTRVEGGPGSEAMHTLPVGATVPVDGPWGLFTLERVPPDAPLLFVATGTGLTPIRAMIEAELAKANARPVRLVFGCRREVDRLYADDLAAWASTHARFAFDTACSRPTEGGPAARVQDRIPEALEALRPHGEPHVLICGLRAMVEDVRALLKEAYAIGRERIHTERFD
ncbi:MAG: FAD-dependent oxidoreductase [Sandaracinus sp.]|nr:FAD-dependent oxidoreductase [Sandaracinus sp.]